ncbi:MAG: hypothetical protein ABH896_02200 [Candidatus Jacksonbacteria bacterium]
MLNFVFHPHFEKEAASLKRRFPFFNSGMESFKRICEVHFDPISPKQVVAPAKLHRIKCFENFTIWKIELAVKKLRPNQFPRVWFAVQGATVAFLCIATHIDNYDDNTMNRKAETLVSSFFN